MKKHEINDIFEKNDDSKLETYLQILLSKCQDIAKESNLIGIIMLILILLFYIADFSKSSTLQIGPISVGDINSVKIFIPLVFSFLIFRYIVISAHKAELHKILKEFSNRFFSFKDPTSDDILHLDDFTRSILPFSIYSELGKLSHKGKSKFGCFGAILIIPLAGISFIPFYLEYIWLKPFLSEFNNLNFIQKSSVVLSIWILIISIYYFIHSAIIGMKEGN